MRAQPCFHMPHGDLHVEGSQCHGERRGGIAVHEHDVVRHGRGTGQHTPREPRQRLALAHDVQVVVHMQGEQTRRQRKKTL